MPVTLGGISAGVGLAQTIGGLFSGHSARKQLDALANRSPVYQPSKAIGDYYSEAMNRYMQNPYNTQFYQQAMNNVNQKVGTGIGALQDRRLALGGVSSLVDQGNRALGAAGVQAEAQRNRNFGQLGQAAGMKAGEDRMAYQYNQLMPWQQKMQILGAKSAGANQVMNAGIGNVFNGLGGISNVMEARELYGRKPVNTNFGASGSW